MQQTDKFKPIDVRHHVIEDEQIVAIVAAPVERLCSILREQVDSVRKIEREIYDIAVNRVGVPREQFLDKFRGHEVEAAWVDTFSASNAAWALAVAADC